MFVKILHIFYSSVPGDIEVWVWSWLSYTLLSGLCYFSLLWCESCGFPVLL